VHAKIDKMEIIERVLNHPAENNKPIAYQSRKGLNNNNF
jgi:hypothetical protein